MRLHNSLDQKDTLTILYPTSRGGGIEIIRKGTLVPKLINVTISYNQASGDGGGIVCFANDPVLVNCIVSNNKGNYGIYISESDPANPLITYSNFWNNESGNFFNCDEHVGKNVMINTTGDSCDAYYNIQSDPHFVDTSSSDFHLSSNSPCIDAGNSDTSGLGLPSWDLDHCERIWDGNDDGLAVIDIGAYEYGAPVVIDTQTIEDPDDPDEKNCGDCGTGTELAFIPPICFKLASMLKKRKKRWLSFIKWLKAKISCS